MAKNNHKETEDMYKKFIDKIENMRKLRELLAISLINTAKENMSTKMADSVANIAGKMINTTKTQLEYCHLRKEKPNIPFLDEPKS